MDEQRIQELHEAYLSGTLSKKDLREWEQLLAANSHEREIKIKMDQTWHTLPADELIHLSSARSAEIFESITGKPFIERKLIWPRIAVAATIALFLAVSALFYFNRRQPTGQPITYRNDVPAGHYGATLTLADGHRIPLTNAANGLLAHQSGVKIAKTRTGEVVYEMQRGNPSADQVNTLSTGKGETYELILPDGTKVWLNAASSLTYHANLNDHGKRRVKLAGEGYFEVTKDKEHPFVVETASQEVEVLGTHFNINSYPDEPATTTTLLQGAVKVTSEQKEQLLAPGQQAANNGRAINVKAVDVQQAIDWKQGDFYFNHVDFKVAMRKIARWYDVEVIYDSSVPTDIRSGGWVPRSNPLSNVLRSIEASGLVHFRLEGRKLYVMK